MRGALDGIPGVHILVEEPPSELSGAGLDSAHLTAEIESTISKAGIAALSRRMAFETPGGPFLHLSITAAGGTTSAGWAAQMEWVPVAWQPTAWSAVENIHGTASVGPESAAAAIAATHRLADQFVVAYLAANLGTCVATTSSECPSLEPRV